MNGSCIKFAVSLHIHHEVSLSQAYRTACQQYAALRSEHAISSHIAYLEAKSYGAVFSEASSPIRRGYAMEEKALSKWSQSAEASVNEDIARKKWRPVFEKRKEDIGEWTRGEEYVHKFKIGQRPTYATGGLSGSQSVLPGNTLAPFGERARLGMMDYARAKEGVQRPKQ